MNRPTAQTFGNDVSLLWLLKNSKTVYRSVLAAAEADTSGGGLTTAEQAMNDYAELQSLVLETANTLEANLQQYAIDLTSSLMADSSEYGIFKQDVYTRISANARNITENSTLLETLENAQIEYLNLINGQIRRGFIADPDHPGQYLYGIAISQDMAFTDQSKEYTDGHTYYGIAADQTFGLYTSTGWQYWINGSKAGWFDSSDGKLHVAQEEVKGDITMGNWQMTDSDGFGIKYIGG